MEEEKDPVPAMAVSASSYLIKAKNVSEAADCTLHLINSFIDEHKMYSSPTMFQIRL